MCRALLLPACLLLAGCSPKTQPVSAPAAADPPPRPIPGKPWFVDVSARAGIDFRHFDPSTPTQYIVENMGSGVAWIDYDNDGWPDLFFVQDGPVPVRPDAAGPRPTHKLYRNNRDGTFTDVTAAVGLDKAGYGMGCAVGDYDNDGYDDLVVTYLGGIGLYHNEPDGKGGRRFADVSARSNLTDPKFATSCGWGDIDGDGFLDLYVCNYVELDLPNYKPCISPETGAPNVCPPTVFPFIAHKLFRNNRDGTFTDVTAESGVAAPKPGAGLAVALVDLDGDGRIDIYVANDMQAAFVFHNQGGGKFKDLGPVSGASLMPNGRLMAGMGIAVGDIDGSGRPSVLVSNYQDEPNMVFLNKGKMVFREWSHPSRLGPATMKTLGFGIELFDADLDGHLDVVRANGHVIKSDAARVVPYQQQAQLFVGDGQAHFTEVSAEAGGFFREKHLGRGVAVADYDNDGRPDLAFGLNSGPGKLLRNETETANRWVRFDLRGDGVKSNTSAIGARVVVEAGGRTLARWVVGGGSYLSASDRRVLVGLGAADRADRVTVTWPSGRVQEFTGLAAGQGWRLTEGKAQAEPAPGPAPRGS